MILEFSIDTFLGNVSRLNNTAGLLKERKVTELAKENTRSEGRKCYIITSICGMQFIYMNIAQIFTLTSLKKKQIILGNNCVSWRQTSSCSPNGNREPINDKSCNETVPNDVSGFCECREGVRTMPKWCRKGKFLNCNDACNIGSDNINSILSSIIQSMK